jgi:hypothetical protein
MKPEEQLRERITAALQSRHATDSVRVTTNVNVLSVPTDATGMGTALRTYLFLERAMVELDGINPKVADDLRDRMDTIWHALTESERALLDARTEGAWSACAVVGLDHDRTTVSHRESELDALVSLAIALGLDADGTDPRATIVTLTAERDAAVARVDRLRADSADYEVLLGDAIEALRATIDERDAALADAAALRLAARAYFATIDNAPPFGAGDRSLREHDAQCKKTAHTLAVLAGARVPQRNDEER